MQRPTPRLIPALCWGLLLTLCGLLLGLKLSDGERQFDTDILALLPAAEQSPLAATAVERMGDQFANDLLLLVAVPRAESEKSVQQAEVPPAVELTEQLASALAASGQFSEVRTRPRTQLNEQLQRFYLPYRQQLLTDDIRRQLQAGDSASLQRDSLRQLHSPVAAPRAAPLPDDPLNLLGRWLQAQQPGAGFQPDAWGLTASDEHYRYRVIQLRFNGSPFDPGRQQALLSAIDRAAVDTGLEDGEKGARLLRSGLLFHAAAGAAQAQREMSTIGIGSLLGIIALLLWHFRSLPPLLLPVLSIGTGLLLALTTSLWLFGQVHVITLAFGASLVGVSVDYALHYLCGQRHYGRGTLRHILPGISLGLITSVLAYSAQALTPFPGLRQIAVFSAVGLVGAWLTVICWFPWLYRPPVATRVSATPLWRGLQALSRWRRPLQLGLAVTALLALAGISRLQFVDDLRSLQSSPAQLLADEQVIQRLSQRPGGSRFLLVQADSDEQLLQTEERLRPPLEALVAEGGLQSYQALSQFIPSRARQQQDWQLVQQQLLHSGALEHFFRTLGVGDELRRQSLQQLARHQPRWLTPADWSQLPIRPLLPWLYLETGDDSRASLISLGDLSGPAARAQLRELASALPGVQLVDRVEEISRLLGRYRLTLGLWMLLAVSAIALLLTVRYGRQGWQVLAAPVSATLLTFGLLALLGQPLNLFNLLAALLVLGIGLDMGIFLRESDQASHAWEAVSLSALTSLLAFGLLALSNTPILHHFGVTVLPGIILTWLLTLAVSAHRIAPANLSVQSNRP